MHADNSARGTESSAEALMHAGPSTAPERGFQRLHGDMHGVEGGEVGWRSAFTQQVARMGTVCVGEVATGGAP